MATTSSTRRVQRVRHELKRRELQVRRVENVSRHFRRVVLGGEALADFVSASFDDHVKLFLDLGGAEPVDIPAAGAVGRHQTVWLLDTEAAALL